MGPANRWELQWSPELPASAWPSTGYCSQEGSKPIDVRPLYLPPVFVILPFKKTKKEELQSYEQAYDGTSLYHTFLLCKSNRREFNKANNGLRFIKKIRSWNYLLITLDTDEALKK